jgi:hypothetical protein
LIKNLETEAQTAINNGEYVKGAKLFDVITENITDLNSNVDIYNFEIYDLSENCTFILTFE